MATSIIAENLNTRAVAVPTDVLATGSFLLTDYGFDHNPSSVWSVQVSNSVGTTTTLTDWYYEESTGRLYVVLGTVGTGNVRLAIIYR